MRNKINGLRRAAIAEPALVAPLPEPASGLVPSGDDPAREEWHLVCITRKGKVSMLKNLDLRTARLTYQKLMPGTRPVRHIMPECGGSWGSSGGSSWGHYTVGGSHDDGDSLGSVEALGPDGVELDPWCDVEPRVIDLREDHDRGVRQGYVRCGVCTPKLKAGTLDETTLDQVACIDMLPDNGDPEDKKLALLYEQVPTAFWLDPKRYDDLA